MLTLVAVGLRMLLRDRVALGLTFVLPVAFFSVFAAAFSAMDDDSLRSARAIVVVEPGDPFGERLAGRLAAEPGLAARIVPFAERDRALRDVARGRADVAVVIPPGAATRPGAPPAAGAPIELHADRSNPLAAGVVEGKLRGAAAAATLEALALPGVGAEALALPLRVVDVLGRTGKRPSIAYFASGLGVLFLMFAVTGRGAILIEERENGVLGRILAARLGMARLLFARWLFLVALGTVQVSVMFGWAAAAFGLDLFHPRALAGFLLVTLAAAAAASSFGLLLASACRTRAQLSGVAVVVILALAAIGGNLFPAFLMPAWLQAAGRLTFNAWALSAYQEIFWYERGLAAVLPEVLGLALAAALFFAAAWALALRWQRSGGLAS